MVSACAPLLHGHICFQSNEVFRPLFWAERMRQITNGATQREGGRQRARGERERASERKRKVGRKGGRERGREREREGGRERER